jgi:putative salt-induced outer membrane protein
MIIRTARTVSATACLFIFSSFTLAQAPPPAQAPAAPPAPAREYSGSFGGGMTLTSGNTTTRNYNLAFSHIHERKNGNTDKITALYLRGKQDGVLTLNRASIVFRDEYKLSSRVFLFGEVVYLSDRFKDISYYISPVGGLGYKVIDTDATKLQFSGGAGGVFEKNGGVDRKDSGSVNAGQSFSQNLGANSKFTENLGTIWNTNDFSNSLTGFSAGLTTSIVKIFDLKIEFLDTYKSKPSNPLIKKNDTSLVISFLMKY